MGLIPSDSFLRIIAAGKAARAMAEAAEERFGDRIRMGLVVTTESPGHGTPGNRWESIAGGHPTPTEASERAGRRALEIAGAAMRGEALVVLLSGGASSLMAAPVAGVTLEEKRATTERLLKAGADINALNTVRKHLSAVKGGQLAARAAGQTVAYAISDVVGDDLSVIASGPTVADPTSYTDALDVLRAHAGTGAYPAGVIAHLERGAAGQVAETPKPGDPRLARAATSLIGGRRNAMAGAALEAASRGYRIVLVEEPVVGEARVAAVRHLERVRAMTGEASDPVCVVSSGETTVTVTGSGRGGRNQEFALAAAPILAQGTWRAVLTTLASVGTDGIDGPTDAAGALLDPTTVERALALGLPSPQQFLDHNNAYAFFAALGDLIHTGPTGTNAGDLQVILIA